jgi:poly(3-hydroxybutyrate) depolymerase
MFGPDSRLLLALLLIASVAALAGAIRLRPVAAKAACGTLAIVVAMVSGVAVVNQYYAYYTAWGQLWADVHGTTGNLGVIPPAAPSAPAVQAGHLGWIDLPGKLSGDNRRGLVYLPPQYSQAQYARVQFPVVELFHGTPGSPLAWDTLLKIEQVANTLLAQHQIGPMILVMPSINGAGTDYQDCVNGPAGGPGTPVTDDTYLTQDVRTDIFAHYRASHDPYSWGAAGYSSGGYCAANLALRHRTSFGAAAVIEGYFRAADGPAGAALDQDGSLEAANSPLYEAESLRADSGPVPAFWVTAGAADKTDYQTATAFVAAMDRLQQVPFIKLPSADSAYAWSAALPAALTWLWQQLAPPDLRVLFPVHTANQNIVVKVPVRIGPPHAHVHRA